MSSVQAEATPTRRRSRDIPGPTRRPGPRPERSHRPRTVSPIRGLRVVSNLRLRVPQRRFCRCGGSPAHGVTHETQEIGISDPRINDRIRVPEVRLVGPGGEQVGIVRVQDALRLARESDLDLVEVAPNAKPPVAKLMDFGKYKYEAAVKARESRKNPVSYTHLTLPTILLV